MLHFSSIRWRIALPYTLLILGMMIGLASYVAGQVRDERTSVLESELRAEARLMADSAELRAALTDNPAAIAGLALRWGALLGRPVRILNAQAVVVGDSQPDLAASIPASAWPEIRQALQGRDGRDVRAGPAGGNEAIYIASPVRDGERLAGVISVSLLLSEAELGLAGFRQSVFAVTVIGMLLAVGLALFIAERSVSPVRNLTRLAERLAEGDLDERLVAETRDEVGQLTGTLNHMADQLREKVALLDSERGRLHSVLEHMADGVLVIDGAGTVRLSNSAANVAFGDRGADLAGLEFPRVVTDEKVLSLWRTCRDSGRDMADMVDLDRPPLFYRVTVTPFAGADAGACLILFHDLTQVRRLETVRRDFVSNVSHELRTPLATLRAVTDTLMEGALDDPAAARRFLDSMSTELSAMTRLVEDLLDLSRAESGQLQFQLRPTAVADVVMAPVERLRSQAERAGLTIEVGEMPAVSVLADEDRIHQVMVNLLQNAIKFSAPGGTVRVTARVARSDTAAGVEVIFGVADTGVGIAPQDLPRIFERFYKADRARSGGGTGLGLAIAKHIVQAHGGRIWAESGGSPGSRFYFSLAMIAAQP